MGIVSRFPFAPEIGAVVTCTSAGCGAAVDRVTLPDAVVEQRQRRGERQPLPFDVVLAGERGPGKSAGA
jgi:hypothetical protein